MEQWKKQLNEAWQRVTEYQLGNEAPYELTELFSSLLQDQRQRMAKEIEEEKWVEEGGDGSLYQTRAEGFNSGLQAALNIVLGEGEKI